MVSRNHGACASSWHRGERNCTSTASKLSKTWWSSTPHPWLRGHFEGTDRRDPLNVGWKTNQLSNYTGLLRFTNSGQEPTLLAKHRCAQPARRLDIPTPANPGSLVRGTAAVGALEPSRGRSQGAG